LFREDAKTIHVVWKDVGNQATAYEVIPSPPRRGNIYAQSQRFPQTRKNALLQISKKATQSVEQVVESFGLNYEVAELSHVLHIHPGPRHKGRCPTRIKVIFEESANVV
jgi:hypothetical protein